MDYSKGWGINETANLLHYNDVIVGKVPRCVYFKRFQVFPVKMCFYPFGVSKIIKLSGVSSSSLISHSTLLNHLVYHFLLIIMALVQEKLS